MAPQDYLRFEWETRDARSVSGNQSWRLYSKDEFVQEQRGRFSEEYIKDLRAGAKALGLKGTSILRRDQLLTAIALARWERLPRKYKLEQDRIDRTQGA